MGESRNPNEEHLLELAQKAKIKKDHANEIIEVTKASLAKWPRLAKQYGVSNIKLVKQKLNGQTE